MNNNSRHCCLPLLTTLLIISSFCLCFVSATQSITTTQFLRDSETLVSDSAIFKIGFFSPGNSTNRYVGIWYTIDELEVVWVANRDNPLHDTSGVLKISDNGNLQVLDGQNKVFWSSNVSHQGNSSVAQLLDTGNLVLLSSASGTIIWQSFDYPTDSFLPQVSFTVKEDTDEKPILRSWKGPMDPSVGRFSLGIFPRNLPEFFTLDGDDKPYWRTGPWNGHLFIGVPFMHSQVSSGISITKNHDGTLYLAYNVANKSLLERFELRYDGIVLQKFWNKNTGGKWDIKWQSMESECEVYGTCGPFGTCIPDTSPICTCLQGFEPKNMVEWSRSNWTSGCVRRMTLQCNTTGGKADGFLRLKHMKVPDYAYWLLADRDGCERNCLANCLCIAYAYDSGIGCMIWNQSLIDIQQLSGDGADLFIRLNHLELVKTPTNKRNWIIAGIVIMATTIFGVLAYYIWRWKRKKATNKREDQVEFKDLPVFKFGTLEVATSKFSENNKLGEGGFGAVYKGKLEDGQKIAVKRLSRASGQGVQEFMNEVIVISKLQHRNLVKLLGCCISGEEKLLVYEYMPNKSLDALLFDASHQGHLDWKIRFNIIEGISRGLLYLHRDSRLRIIHRDLKPSNILLDEELNPKISDFGMARIFGTKQHQANTSRVVGTYGYMSPEYAMEGHFSEKSDMYSFGVLLLELVSGKRNSSSFGDESWRLLPYAWKLWNENNMLSLIDQTNFCPEFQEDILLCIQLGLLCVQEFPEDRPSISTFVTMLDNYNDVKDLPHPKQPGFTQRIICSTDGISGDDPDCCSVNYASLTMISGR